MSGMATTTKSKSTRTTKKPAKTAKKTTVKTTKAKTASKTAPAKTKANVKTKTVVAEKVTKKPANKAPLTPFERLRSLHVSSALLYLAFAIVSAVLISASAVAVRLGIQSRDEFAGSGTVVLGPASEVLYNLNPAYVLTAALLVSALASVLMASRLRTVYEASVTNRTSGLRWLALGVSAGLTLEFVNLLAGINDMAVLKLSAFLILVTALLSFMAERENVGVARPKWLAFSLSLVTGALAWLPLAGTLVGTSIYGMERFGWHVYAISAVLLLGFTAIAFNLYKQIKNGSAGDYFTAEERYLRIDLFTKVVVFIIAISALK